MKRNQFSIEEEIFLTGFFSLDKDVLIKEIENLKVSKENKIELEEFKKEIIEKLNNLSKKEVEELMMNIS
ncbi:hypothetical protein [Clostridium arbusti]|uniref:hypothetical protein n=1 Tax=Clostridium arbusti TaxID=1137848 RepID=UPI0002885772|nr:hypothetical protein [Clostridium arbusti]